MLKFREGWQGEHLARFILSKFAFIAEPSTVVDDIGTDFYCTNFDVEIVDKEKYLLPKNSFVIQIKKRKKNINIDITNKLRFLDRLEVPYFVGIVTTEIKCNKVEIYSGEFIPIFLSEIDFTQKKVFLTPCETRTNGMWDLEFDKLKIFMPKIIELDIDCEFKDKNDFEKLNEFYSIISTIQKNISARKSGEYIFNLQNEKTSYIIAGPGSAQTYRKNLIDRLTESFYNIHRIIEDSPADFYVEEFKAYEHFYHDLISIFGSIPPLLKSRYDECKRANEIYEEIKQTRPINECLQPTLTKADPSRGTL